MDPCTLIQLFPFVPPDILCRIHEVGFSPEPVTHFIPDPITASHPAGEGAVKIHFNPGDPLKASREGE